MINLKDNGNLYDPEYKVSPPMDSAALTRRLCATDEGAIRGDDNREYLYCSRATIRLGGTANAGYHDGRESTTSAPSAAASTRGHGSTGN
ncbi:hypothetical protein GCM10011405_29500 [Rufibacter glacialis]|nr:hypothetical protein GCM10011405_29500 [Rufibacter glacialis]